MNQPALFVILTDMHPNFYKELRLSSLGEVCNLSIYYLRRNNLKLNSVHNNHRKNNPFHTVNEVYRPEIGLLGRVCL
jgi:hypothetical protein